MAVCADQVTSHSLQEVSSHQVGPSSLPEVLLSRRVTTWEKELLTNRYVRGDYRWALLRNG